MKTAVSQLLLQVLGELAESELKQFRAKLRDVALWKAFNEHLRKLLPEADLVQWLSSHFGMEYGAELTVWAHRAMNQEARAQSLLDTLDAYGKVCSEHLEIISSVRSVLHSTLARLGKEELGSFKAKVADVELRDTSFTNPPIPAGRLEKVALEEMVEELISHYGVRYAIEATLSVLRDMNQKALGTALFQQQRNYIKQTWEWTAALFRVSECLIHTWGSLGEAELENFRSKVMELDQEQGSSPMPREKMETAVPQTVMEELIHEYGEERALRMTQDILRGMKKVALAKTLMEASKTDPWREKQCELCPRETDSPEELNPKIIQAPKGSQERYSVHIPRAGCFRCPKTKLRFRVRAPVTIQYESISWDQHLPEEVAQQFMVAGPLFDIQVDLAEAVEAVYLPHFLCLAGGEITVAQMQVAHFGASGMRLEKPARVRSFHAVLENPSFSLLGVLWQMIRSKRQICIHSLVLLYRTLQAADITLHLYLIPDDCSVIQAVENYEKRWQSFHVPKPPLTKPLHYGVSYCAVSSAPSVEISPQALEFQRRGPEKHQLHFEVYSRRMEKQVELSVRDREQTNPVWDSILRPGDVNPPASPAEEPSANVLGASMAKTMKDHLVDTLKDLCEGELKEFKGKLTDIKLKEGHTSIPRGELEKAVPVEIADLLVKRYGEVNGVKVTIHVLEAMSQRNLSDRLHKATGASQG
ncbi:uncharacterized protein LOC142014919 [Carettochelys insculpta]|uniref:uncharacterized protein LOC142014919 n=1 Tax=Carettochelys insculpta TaxID=44489 RepID=UPI003EBD8BBC